MKTIEVVIYFKFYRYRKTNGLTFVLKNIFPERVSCRIVQVHREIRKRRLVHTGYYWINPYRNLLIPIEDYLKL